MLLPKDMNAVGLRRECRRAKTFRKMRKFTSQMCKTLRKMRKNITQNA